MPRETAARTNLHVVYRHTVDGTVMTGGHLLSINLSNSKKDNGINANMNNACSNKLVNYNQNSTEVKQVN